MEGIALGLALHLGQYPSYKGILSYLDNDAFDNIDIYMNYS